MGKKREIPLEDWECPECGVREKIEHGADLAGYLCDACAAEALDEDEDDYTEDSTP